MAAQTPMVSDQPPKPKREKKEKRNIKIKKIEHLCYQRR